MAWDNFLPPILWKDFEPKLAKNRTHGMRISFDDNLRLVACNYCSKKILESALLNHCKGCTGPIADMTLKTALPPVAPSEDSTIPIAEKSASPSASVGSIKKFLITKKRKLDCGSGSLSNHLISEHRSPGKSKGESILSKKVKTVTINLDTQCGVKIENGICGRAITCKMHAVSMKRAVAGRSSTYDTLHAEYQTKSTKKGLQIASTVEKTESFAPEVEIINLLNVIQTNKPKPYAFNRIPITTLVKNRKKQILIDVFAKA